MPRMTRRNYLIPRNLVADVRKLVRLGRFRTESEAVRASLARMVKTESERAAALLQELDRAAAETGSQMTGAKTAGQLVHEAHVEEAHWA